MGIYMPGKDLAQLPGIGEQLKIHTYLNVREDAMQLFGFLTGDELEVFRLLITVNGIGPKGGLGILSALSADELRFAVMAGRCQSDYSSSRNRKENSGTPDPGSER